uniref:ZP domain-containing protein n=1 Tax=Ditylenchus dipsaci TaxID=166011 RepID=A0A915EGS6_9BILA
MVSVCQAISIDNDIIGEPDIECLDQEIRVWKIYAKGKSEDPECSKDDFASKRTKKPQFDLPLGMCGMKFDPRGMYYGITLVISFHPLFITKVDQAFHVKCFFEEANRGLTAELGVSAIPTTEVEARHGIPGCSYSIHRSVLKTWMGNQPELQFSSPKVGDKVLHQWHCDDTTWCATTSPPPRGIDDQLQWHQAEVEAVGGNTTPISTSSDEDSGGQEETAGGNDTSPPSPDQDGEEGEDGISSQNTTTTSTTTARSTSTEEVVIIEIPGGLLRPGTGNKVAAPPPTLQPSPKSSTIEYENNEDSQPQSSPPRAAQGEKEDQEAAAATTDENPYGVVVRPGGLRWSPPT